METVNQEVKKVLNVSNEALISSLTSKRDRLYQRSRELSNQVQDRKSHPLFAEMCEISRQYYSTQRDLESAIASCPIRQAEIKEANDRAIMAFNSDKRFSITE